MSVNVIKDAWNRLRKVTVELTGNTKKFRDDEEPRTVCLGNMPRGRRNRRANIGDITRIERMRIWSARVKRGCPGSEE
jgi:hypothetical protein